MIVIKNAGENKWLLHSYTVEGGKVAPGQESDLPLNPKDKMCIFNNDPGVRYELRLIPEFLQK